MQYISTRGETPLKQFCEILLEGLAPDGGLFMPIRYPKISWKTLMTWSSLSYPELAYEIFRLYVDDIPAKDLHDIIFRTYTEEVFGSKEITPVKELRQNLYLQELSNGPTLAFKDVALQLVGNLFQYELSHKKTVMNILGATSGDTGSAAQYAMLGKHNIRVFMLSPNGAMSPFQTAQMYSLNDKNIHNISVRGSFDNCQDVIKKIFNDSEFKRIYKLGAVNSINWARILAQVVYYFYGYFQVVKREEIGNKKINFAVPSGNFGNICAGHVAKMMNLPIKHLLLATNENNVLNEFFSTGCYRPRKETQVTSSPSMDITKASNLERFVFDMLYRDGKKVAELFKRPEGFNLSKEEFYPEWFGFNSMQSSHKDRLENIKKIWEMTDGKVIIDTHTADAMKIALHHVEYYQEPTIVLETAKAIKFPDAICEAIGIKPERPEKFKGIENKEKFYTVMNPDYLNVKDYITKYCIQ